MTILPTSVEPLIEIREVVLTLNHNGIFQVPAEYMGMWPRDTYFEIITCKLFLNGWTRKFCHLPGSSGSQRKKYVLYVTYYSKVGNVLSFLYRIIIQGRKEAQTRNILSNNRFLDQPKLFLRYHHEVESQLREGRIWSNDKTWKEKLWGKDLKIWAQDLKKVLSAK